MHLALAALLLISLANSQSTTTTVLSAQSFKKGLTFQATVWPTYKSNWAGRFSCNNCDPFQGDQYCNISLPLICISSPNATVRPLYNVAVQYTPFSVLDGGYYDGWTGGVIQATLPVLGSAVTSYKVGDSICKGYFGNNSVFATFNSGYYMDFMNQLPAKTWAFWDWSKVKQGGWNFWGYFDLHYRGRGWVWSSQASGNCGNWFCPFITVFMLIHILYHTYAIEWYTAA